MLSLNFIASAFMALVVANLFISAAANAPQAPEVHVFPPPVSVGRERSFSSNRDASMYIQQQRRQAVVNGFYGSPGYVLRETPHTSGFTNGVVEMYSITGICHRIFTTVTSNIYDGGFSTTENPIHLDGGDVGTTVTGRTYDAGNAGTNVVGTTETTVVC